MTVLHSYPWTGVEGVIGTRLDFAVYRVTRITSARPCQAADLTYFPTIGAGMGTAYGDLQVRNRSSTACSLEGRPGLAMVDERGVVWLSTPPGLTSGRQLVLVPNSWAESTGWIIGSSCGGFPRTSTLRVTVQPSDGTVSLPFPVGQRQGPSSCSADDKPARTTPRPGGLAPSPFEPIAHPPWQQLEVALDRDQDVRLIVPSRVRRGTVLRYTVRISPRPTTGVPLWDSACPLFRQTLQRSGPDYVLNCQPLQFLETPQDAADFAMQVPVPMDARLGPTTLSWQLVEPTRAAVTTTVDIVS